MSLKEYRRKRKFGQTPEPDSTQKIRRGSSPLSFVVQKHAATRTHYDFRLEINGVLKSWAVPKGPSMTSQTPRLAVHVEDHPLPYGKFEGVIPKGNYGAGTVMIWDSGHFSERSSKGRRESEKALEKGFKKGHITFVLEGKKLRGEFALVKLKKKGAPPNGWLLLKKQDSFASREDVLRLDRSVVTERTMEEIGAEAVAKGQVWLPKRKVKSPAPKRSLSPSLPRKSVSMPRKIKVMQPLFSAKVPEMGKFLFERFGTGVRAVAEIEGAGAKLYSRMFLSFETKYPLVVRALKGLGVEAVLDGEIVKKGKDVFYSISDLLFLNGEDLREVPLKRRRETLSRLKLSPPLELTECADDPLNLSHPSVVAKEINSFYRGGLSKDWLRLKVSPHSFSSKAKTIAQSLSLPLPKAEKPPLTHLNKIFWPEEGYTKGDLIHYYESVSQYLLPHLIDKPQSLHRQPNGLRDEGFFQKDMTGYLPRRIQTEKVYSASSQKTIHYILCQDEWSLLYLINLGCIELNPWLSRRKTLDKPDFVVIDLDPDNNEFNDVIKVAQEVHRVLESSGAKSYCKTSGASGLHICIPTGAKYDFETGRAFAEAVCRVVLRKFPLLTSMERNPAKRRGRIYLDCLQNRRGQNLAAPYCLRPRPQGTVSAPLLWSEVKRNLKPQSFTIKTMPQRLAEVGDLWKPLLHSSTNLEKSMKQLLKLFHI